MKQFVSQAEFARQMGVSPFAISDAIKRGILPPLVNRKVDYNKAVLAWSKKNAEKLDAKELQKRILILKGDLLEIERDAANEKYIHGDTVVAAWEAMGTGISKHMRNWFANMRRKLKKNNSITERDLDAGISVFNDSLVSEFKKKIFKKRKV